MTDISALEAYAGQLSEAAARSTAASEKQHHYIHGSDQEDVSTEWGAVPSIAKQARLSAVLANASDPLKGAGVVGVVRTPLALAIDGTVAKKLSQAQIDIWEVSHLVTSRPTPTDFRTWDWTPAFEAARVVLGAFGGGVLTFGPGGVYQALEIRLDRSIVLDGRGINATELKQIAGANRDFLKSENFDALTGTGATVSSNALVPSWFGLKNIRVNGNRYHPTNNPSGNTSGRAIAWYGPALIMQGNVLVYGAAGNNIYTEYSNTSGSSGWQGQEEGQFDNVFSRDSGGVGWIFRGPHNSRLNSYIGAFNDGYGFRSESGANYDGGFDWIGSIHTYGNGRGTSPAADTGIHMGEIARVGAMITDGDNAVIAGSNIQIGSYRGYNLGGEMDGLTISGNANTISQINAVVWASSVGRTAFKITGSRNKIGEIDLVTNNPDNNAISITGNSNRIEGGYVQGFSSAGRIGVNLAGTKNKVDLEVTGCATAFNYTAGNNNRVNLEINTSAGQVPVAGSAPSSSDRFNIRSGGTTVGGCKANLQTGRLAMDISTYTVASVAHGLLYTPAPNAVRINWLVSSPDSSVWDEALLRVVTTTATDVVVGYKLASAAPAGTQARIGISIDLTG